MITNNISWSLGSYPNKSFDVCEAPVRRRFQSDHLLISPRGSSFARLRPYALAASLPRASTQISTNQHTEKSAAFRPKALRSRTLHRSNTKNAKFHQHLSLATKVAKRGLISKLRLLETPAISLRRFMQAISAPPKRGIFSLLRSAIAGEQKDFTTGSLNMSLFMLAV